MKSASQILARNILALFEKTARSANEVGQSSGVGQTTISAWIRKARESDPSFNPRLDQLDAFAKAFGHSVSDLFSEGLGRGKGEGEQDQHAPSLAVLDQLQARYAAADPATRTLVDIALARADEPLPDGLSPSMRVLVNMARTAIADEQNRRQ